MNKFYMIPNCKDVSKFNEELILPLENFSVGFDVYFDLEEIENISKLRKVNVIINAFLHKDKLEKIKDLIEKMSFVNMFFVEDLGILNIIDRKRVVLYQNHLINNYKAVNAYECEGIQNIVISNELTFEEISDIRKNTSSNLFYFLIGRNMLMYSRRNLVSSYYSFKGLDIVCKTKEISEKVSKKELIIKEESDSTCIFDKKIFSANMYLDLFDGINFIINFSNMTESETSIILKYYNDKDLCKYVEVDDYFLHNKIIYKVGEK